MDVLRDRYASHEMAAVFTQRARIETARRLWLAVMEAQQQVGIGGVTTEHLNAYRATVDQIDELDHHHRELFTRHETKAWIEVWDEQAGLHGKLHLGLTSSDITENITAWQLGAATEILVGRISAVLSRLHVAMRSWQGLVIVGRTHNLPAQPTTLGKRFAVCASEMMLALTRLQMAMIYPARGIAGAVGTNSDLLALAKGDREALRHVARSVHSLGIHCMQPAVGQTPPRSVDLELASAVTQVCSGPASFSTMIRLMVGQGLATELAQPGQVGSSAMPHKVNPRYAERVSGLLTVVRGFASMLTENTGDIWNEGDVSDSAVRRIAWEGLFLAADGLLRTFMTALDQFEPDLIAIAAEVEQYQHELSTGRMVAYLVDEMDMSREAAHSQVARPRTDNELWLACIPAEKIREIRGNPDIGDAIQQIQYVCDWVTGAIVFEQADYDPGPML